MSPTDLASKTGISLRTIERIEAGQIRRPHPLTRRAIALALECDEIELWPQAGDEAPVGAS